MMTALTLAVFCLRMLKDPPATTWLVLEIRSEILSSDCSESKCLKKLLEVRRPDSRTDVL